jgi:hypothetical protein
MGNKFEGFLIQGGSKKLDRIFDKKELGPPSRNSHRREKALGGPSKFFYQFFLGHPV